MKIAFSTEHLSLRGTEIALFDYAKYNKTILGNESLIFINGNQPEYKNPARDKFLNEFGIIHAPRNITEFEKTIDSHKIDVHYKICAGNIEPLPSNCKNMIHSVFPAFSPYGDVYAYVSEWLRNHSVPTELKNKYEFVPHIVDTLNISDNKRIELGIPQTATVLGYYGGNDSFDIEYAKRSIQNALNIRSDLYFIFMNIGKFLNNNRVFFLPGTYDLTEKGRFINTCDGMIHARSRGETFGLAIAEFALKNKPIITYGLSPEKSHIELLGSNALIYNNEVELDNILKNFIKTHIDYYNYKQFTPHTVMQKFKKIFLQEKHE